MALTTFRGLKKAFGVASVVTCTLGMFGGMMTAAHAQAIPAAVTKPLAFKLGVYTPSNNQARVASSDILFSGEVEYTIQSLEQSSSYSVISAGYINQGDLRIIPLTIGQMFTDGRQNYYYGFGLGLYDVKMNVPGLTSNDDKKIFGFYGAVGLNFTSQFFGEVKYHYPYKYDNQFIGGVQLMAGFRY